jgi:hypothetical protein
MLLGRVLIPKVLGRPRAELFILVRSLLSVVCVRQENSEELFIVSARHGGRIHATPNSSTIVDGHRLKGRMNQGIPQSM